MSQKGIPTLLIVIEDEIPDLLKFDNPFLGYDR